jgi:hypothetical protein
MKAHILAIILAMFTLASPAIAKEKKVDFRDILSRATLAVYQGKQVCGYDAVDTFFGTLDVWSCDFKTKFVCTATVVLDGGNGMYGGLTAGHCFNYEAMDKGIKYYVADNISDHPVVKEIQIVKFDYSDRYDYGIFEFHSGEKYPAIAMLGVDEPVPGIGTEVFNANFSLGVIKQLTEGKIVSSQIAEGSFAKKFHGRFFTTVGIGPGASGSAIVDKNTHKIIGLVEAVFPGTQMATLTVPMGRTFHEFYEDASAGLKPRKPAGPLFRVHPEPKVVPPTFRELLEQVWDRIWSYINRKLGR